MSDIIDVRLPLAELTAQLSELEKKFDESIAKMSKGGEKPGTQIEKGMKKGEKQTEKTNKKLKDQGKVTDDLNNKFTGLLNSNPFGRMAITLNTYAKSMLGVTTATKTATTATRVFRTALIATGIGAIVVLIGSLIAALKDSEQGQNRFNKILGVTGSILGNFRDILAALGERIIEVFMNPRQAIEDFAELVRKNIVTRFEGLAELIPALGRAISLLFKGEFAEAGKVAVDAVGKVTLGIESTTDAIKAATAATKEFMQELEDEARLAAQVADMRAKADLIERKLLVERAQLEGQIAELRLKSRQEDEFSAAQRRQALIDAQKLQDSLISKEEEALVLRRDAQVLENSFARSNKQNLDDQAQAEAAVFQARARRTDQQRSTQRELNRINKELSREEQQRAAEAEKLANDERKRLEEEIEAINESVDAIRNKFKSQEELQEESLMRQTAALEAALQKELIQYEEFQLLLEQLNADFEARRQAIQDETDQKERARLEKLAAYDVQIEREKTQAKIAILQNFTAAAQDIAGDNAIASQALASFQALLNAYLSITSVLADPKVPTALKPFLAASIGALAFTQVSRINSATPPQFYEGTESVPLRGNKRGRDTVPAMLHEGEAVIPTAENRKYPGMAKAWITGDLDKYIRVRHVMPQLVKQKHAHEQEKAALIAQAMRGSVDAHLNDSRIVRQLRVGNALSAEQIDLLKKSKRINPFRA